MENHCDVPFRVRVPPTKPVLLQVKNPIQHTYRAGDNCTVQLFEPTMKLHAQIFHIDIEPSNAVGCGYDSLRLYDGMTIHPERSKYFYRI
jgi:hypothetical protein